MPTYTEEYPFHFAVQENNRERVQQLLREGYEVDVRDHRGATPLIVAARWGCNELIDLLLKRGAKINGKDKASPVEHGGRTALFHACVIGRIGTVRLLLERGAKPDVIAQRGHTALSYVISAGGNGDIISLLLEHGADPNGPNRCWEPPLVAAAGRNDLQLISELLRRGADPNRIGASGEVALSSTSSVHCAQALLRGGADVDLRSADGQTPLFRNLIAGDQELLKCYIDAGADVNARDKQDKYGISVLMRLAENPRVDVAKLLVSAGVEINAAAAKNCSTLDYIANFKSHYNQEERQALVDFLRSKGAKFAQEIAGRSKVTSPATIARVGDRREKSK